jgi:hypothetical protein
MSQRFTQPYSIHRYFDYRFILGRRNEVTNADILRRERVGLILCFAGDMTEPFNYPQGFVRVCV